MILKSQKSDFIWLNWFNLYHLPLTLILTILGHCKVPLWGWNFLFFWISTTSNSVSKNLVTNYQSSPKVYMTLTSFQSVNVCHTDVFISLTLILVISDKNFQVFVNVLSLFLWLGHQLQCLMTFSHATKFACAACRGSTTRHWWLSCHSQGIGIQCWRAVP